MAAFYHALSMGVMYVGSFAVTQIISDYEGPVFPVSILMTIASGPVEEILFFGLAHYIAGTPQAVLITGMMWSVAHLFGTQVLQVNALGYVNFLIAIPHMFFSLRVWLSGKGWFAIVFHSAWNLAFLISYCHAGIRQCPLIGQGYYFGIDLLSVGIAASLISMILLLHKKAGLSRSSFRFSALCTLVAFAAFEILIALKYLELLSLF